MSNPGGGNQFGNFTLQPKYGDVKKQTELLREAPISGAPLSGAALNTPRRQQRAASRPKRQAKPEPMMAPPVAMPQPPAGMPPVAFQQIARIPGASPLVQSIFGA